MLTKHARSFARRSPAYAPRPVARAAVRMRGAVSMPLADTPAPPRRTLYQPPHLLAKYYRAKLAGSVLFGLIFVGWLWLQWSNPWMRGAVIGLLALTAWFTATSILADLRRHRGRQIELAGDGLLITTPQGTCWIQLPAVDHARWADDAGLALVRADGQTLGTIDLMLLADEDEARRFLGWLRQHATIQWSVRWPPRA